MTWVILFRALVCIGLIVTGIVGLELATPQSHAP